MNDFNCRCTTIPISKALYRLTQKEKKCPLIELGISKNYYSKFYWYSQNNSGGFFIECPSDMIASDVVIEALSLDQANSIMLGLVEGEYSDYCECCGERWYYDHNENDACKTDSLILLRSGQTIQEYLDDKTNWFHKTAAVHLMNGSAVWFESKKVPVVKRKQ